MGFFLGALEDRQPFPGDQLILRQYSEHRQYIFILPPPPRDRQLKARETETRKPERPKARETEKPKARETDPEPESPRDPETESPKPQHLDTLLRSLVLGQLGMYGDEAIVGEARRRLGAHVANASTLPADLRSPVYKTVMSQADEKTFDQMLKLYREADLHEEKDRISRSLGATRDPNLIQRVLQFAISDEVRNQDTVFVIISVAMTAPGRSAAWAFFKKHHEDLVDRYEGGYLVTRLIKYITENFATEEMASEVEAFFQERLIPGTERTVQQSLETIRLNAAWLQRDQDAIKKYLTELEG
ncbi:puromycin-sensitive aminopeptidase-like [Penaeus indicus]|uniref:puromycin-sensitive aminopeptidase-like n=1 Tax=Penaeus indicus TaxID=29960 RepID=UPI00300CF3B6